MIITTLLLILTCSVLGKSIGKLKNVDWSEAASLVWAHVKSFGLKSGRTVCTNLLNFYYVMLDEHTTVTDKALIFGAILYIVSPFDLLPRKVLGFLGIFDDAAILAFVCKKISDKITPEISSLVNATLDEWFGISAPANLN